MNTKHTLTAVIILSAMLVYGMLCVVSGSLGHQQSNGEQCVFAFATCVYLGTGIVSFLGLVFIGMFRPDYAFFPPVERVRSLLKPPEVSI